MVAAAVYAVPDSRSGDQVMAALEVTGPETFDVAALAEYLGAQEDLGSKGKPRLLRLSARLPVTGSNKVLKRELQAQRWRCDEPVYRWAGRDRHEYRRMGDADLAALENEFGRHGRARYL